MPEDANSLEIVLICGVDNKLSCVYWSLEVVISNCWSSVGGWTLDGVASGFSVGFSAVDIFLSSFASISSVVINDLVGTVFGSLVSVNKMLAVFYV